MSNILYKLFNELDKLGIPDRYMISFTRVRTGRMSSQNYIRISVTDTETCASTKWMLSMQELETTKIDFVKDNIECMIDQLHYQEENKNE